MSLTVITPPAGSAVSVGEAKAYLRIGEPSEDALVSALIVASQLRVEVAIGQVLIRQTVRKRIPLQIEQLIDVGVPLRPGPDPVLVSVELIKANAVSEEVTAGFWLDQQRLRLSDHAVISALSTGVALDITFEAGFADAAHVPGDLKLGVLRLVADAYGRRGLPGDGMLEPGLPEDVIALLAPYQEVRL